MRSGYFQYHHFISCGFTLKVLQWT